MDHECVSKMRIVTGITLGWITDIQQSWLGCFVDEEWSLFYLSELVLGPTALVEKKMLVPFIDKVLQKKENFLLRWDTYKTHTNEKTL